MKWKKGEAFDFDANPTILNEFNGKLLKAHNWCSPKFHKELNLKRYLLAKVKGFSSITLK